MAFLLKRAGYALALLAALGPAVQAAPAVHTVLIDGMRFIPQTVEVKAGDTVVWRNKDPFPHTATATQSGSGGPSSPAIAPGASWRFKAAKPGSYPYLCTLHSTMTATLVVK
ncbi:cupredoxin domain-containing protein [Massilia litorea]|uniref:cupredoxin domain-containing protein n=1 Tax=Massilia litorea TaxID=2769491 RepID=UPI001D0D1149|nr:cupredoxin family copper-binding protein [Massilia litorea]